MPPQTANLRGPSKQGHSAVPNTSDVPASEKTLINIFSTASTAAAAVENERFHGTTHGTTASLRNQTEGVKVVLKLREVSLMGVAVLGMVVLLLVLVRFTTRAADAQSRLSDKLSSRLDDWYVNTGSVSILSRFWPSLTW